ncbi:hypothetical protein VaNZ11_004936 [Volvox africanus]|uniref:Uncharacterized protein n=1 Tax=Volvox africanus TaxID=51714 RepID=A0ABQ5RYW5_9CHLO|nr:hypothetical protein VaNZ11_004936 [Volvox africanus]
MIGQRQCRNKAGRATMLLIVLIGSITLSASALNVTSVKYPVPAHIAKWTDKLKVQRWLDAARAELTKNGTIPLDSNCEDQFGMGYLEKWRAAKKDVCTSGSSTYTCYEHPPGDNGNNVGSMFCTATNVVLDSDDFLGDVITKPGTRYPTPKKGSAKVACTLRDPLPWSRDETADQHTDRWLYGALKAVPEAEIVDVCSNPRRTVSYPVYFVTRMDPTNAYHHFEEVNNLFAALWIFPHKELLQQGITIVTFDGAPLGFFLELWRRVAYPYRIRFLRQRSYPPGTCFQNVLIASMPHRSFYTHFWPGRTTKCRSLFFTAVVNWAHALMSDVRPESYIWPDGQHRQNDDTVVGRVTWVSRRNFETANQHKFTSWQSQRMVGNDDHIINTLASAVMQWNGRSCLRNPGKSNCRDLPVYFEYGTMELGDHRWYPDQLMILSRTNVLVAIHGAGVFNEIWLRPSTSSVLEILHNSMGNYHYHNIAAFLGLPYFDMGSAHDPNVIASKLMQILDDTAQRMVSEHKRKAAESVAG